jgi:steroid 5-alpha reductase family enzyme
MTKSGGVNREHHRSNLQKLTFWLLHLASIGVCGWIAFLGGWERIGAWLGREQELADPVRAKILLGCAVVYFLRHGVTLFYLLERRVDWSEVFGIVSFMAIIEIGLVIVGGGAFRAGPAPLGLLDVAAVILFIAGSWLNTWSEVQRKLWKRDPVNKGKCYTGGLFYYSMHINYFGDVVLFTGWCLLTHSLWTLVLPILMAFMFAFMHIPALDSYLAGRYGAAFDDYARKTKKFIPYVW